MATLRRFHKEVYFPDWANDEIAKFSRLLSGVKLIYSYHANEKLRKTKARFRRAIKEYITKLNITDEDLLQYIFEFYTNKDNIVKKVCYRIPFKELEIDVIIVISSSSKIVTIYINNNFGDYSPLNSNLYEKQEGVENEIPS